MIKIIKTTKPETTLSFNEWMEYIFKLIHDLKNTK